MKKVDIFNLKGEKINDVKLDENIFGKVILKIPKLGYVQYFLARQGGWIFVILIPCLVVVSCDILKLIKALGRKTKVIRR